MSTAAASTTTARNIPNVACHLPFRTLLHVHGLESTKFLQGLLTNDIESIQTPNSSMFCHLLNQKGRAMFESFVAIPHGNSKLASNDPKVGSYLMECHVDVAARLQRHLKMHKLRSKVKIKNLTDSYDVWWSSHKNTNDTISPTNTTQEDDSTVLCSFEDPRAPTLGNRTFVTKGTVPTVGTSTDSSTSTPMEVEHTYNMLRLLHGALEGTEVDGVIPLECNLDWLNGVVFDKGCYLGQELTARTHFRGLLRKRCFPVVVTESMEPAKPRVAISISPKEAQDIVYGVAPADQLHGVSYQEKSLPLGTKVLNDGGKRAGKMMTADATPGNVGIALLRLEHVLGVPGNEDDEVITPERLLTASDNGVVRPFSLL
jgi:transferase CAF17, mitochondrial